MSDWPDNLILNAHIGAAKEGKIASTAVVSQAVDAWSTSELIPKEFSRKLAPEAPPDLKNWKDVRVGWGLILPYRPGLSPAELGSADDAPEPIRNLRAQRGNAPVFRYRADWPLSITHLTTYRTGVEETVSIHSSKHGVEFGRLPFYLLIYGPPEVIPWDLQFRLNANRAVGRLDLEGAALENYVNALTDEWKTASSDVHKTLVWSSNNGKADITKLMRDSVAIPVQNQLAKDSDINEARFIDGFNGTATSTELKEALETLKPGFILTTSHGQTGPLDDLQKMTRDLGLLVDQDYDFMQPNDLLAQWEPDGAVWYAHACCSAGSNASTMYDGLVPTDSDVDVLLKTVAKIGDKVAPLPRALLGATKPLRAFVGHVEPTFDWTMRQPDTKGFLTDPVEAALYERLFQPEPAGMALRQVYDQLGSLFSGYDEAYRKFNKGEDTKRILLFCQLAARDVQSMVILGDPTAILPPLK